MVPSCERSNHPSQSPSRWFFHGGFRCCFTQTEKVGGSKASPNIIFTEIQENLRFTRKPFTARKTMRFQGRIHEFWKEEAYLPPHANAEGAKKKRTQFFSRRRRAKKIKIECHPPPPPRFLGIWGQNTRSYIDVCRNKGGGARATRLWVP